MDYGGGFSSSQANDASSTKSRDAQPMLPVTVKQVSDAVPSSADKATFLIDGVDVKNVVMVGMAFEKSERKTDMNFMLDDGTGRIHCHRWMNDTVDTNEVGILSDGVYVRVHGILKGFQGKMQLEVLAIRPVVNFDEVSCHLLTCIHYHTHITKKNGITVSTQARSSVPSASTPLSVPQNSSADQVSGQFSANGPKDIDQMVTEYLEQPSSLILEKGVHVNEIATHLKLPLEKIRKAIGCLETEGTVYSTIDDDHYKSTTI